MSHHDLDELNAFIKEMEGEFEWELKRFILPRVCYATLTWTGFFPQMYIGTRTHKLLKSKWSPPEVRQVSKEEFLFAKLEGGRRWDRVNS